MERQYFTATDLGSHFHYSCQLALWKTFHQKLGEKIPGQVHSARTRATFSRGYSFENSIIKRLDELGLVLKFSKKESLEAQVANDPRDHLYVIGSSFKEDALFRDEYLARGVTPVSFGMFKPDFIEIWKRVVDGKLIFEWHVIDAKSTKSIKVQFPSVYSPNSRSLIKYKCSSTGVLYKRFFPPIYSFPAQLHRSGSLMRTRRHPLFQRH